MSKQQGVILKWGWAPEAIRRSVQLSHQIQSFNFSDQTPLHLPPVLNLLLTPHGLRPLHFTAPEETTDRLFLMHSLPLFHTLLPVATSPVKNLLPSTVWLLSEIVSHTKSSKRLHALAHTIIIVKIGCQSIGEIKTKRMNLILTDLRFADLQCVGRQSCLQREYRPHNPDRSNGNGDSCSHAWG